MALFIYVTKIGAVFDRTKRRNSPIKFDAEYETVGGSVVFTRTNKEPFSIIVKRYSENGKLSYSNEITETGMYIVLPLMLKKLPSAPKEVRLLYNKIRSISDKIRFKIIEDSTTDFSHKIQFSMTNVKGVIESRFVVRVNPNTLESDDVERSVDIIRRASALDLRTVLRHFNIQNQTSIVITVDDDFIETAEMIQKNHNKE